MYSMREFIVYSRTGRTDSKWINLHDAGRLDIIHECIVASLFLSHGLRRDVVFHAVLYGPPRPPLHLEVKGESLYDVRTDQKTWEKILRKVLSGGNHPGITVSKMGFENLIRAKAEESQVYVLEEGGRDIFEVDINEHPIFVLGDHVGLPKKAESFALRYGEKISLGKKPYLAATCITVINYLLDRKGQDLKQR
ncbi:tRNA (pseudouridine(54)-N(1))-methyltransferase TrmY [Candidatus Bathyarchaeota archaeon]|nr:tRNA (pseudouridine(54)-N(1))-methyltransferase TrmY [Candidatus Bathyarchaeota archaeon]